MRNPGGVLITISDEITETDTFTCAHCCRVTQVKPRERPEDIGGFCRKCDGLICGPCVDRDRCVPVEKMMEQMESKLRVREYFA